MGKDHLSTLPVAVDEVAETSEQAGLDATDGPRNS
jgi:hypothetical protein